MDRRKRHGHNTNWDPLADWYDGWVGEHGSEHHRRLAIPAVLDLLAVQPDEHILDIGAGSGVLARSIVAGGARYVGVDVSARLLNHARRHHRCYGRFIQADATCLAECRELERASFDGAVLLLSIQDMEPLDAVLRSAAWALRPGGRLVILMTHPCFRVPRQSGWGWDEGRRLRFRRVDRYLGELAVPMKPYGDGRASRSFHRPLETYVNTLAACGLSIDQLREIATYRHAPGGPRSRADNLAFQEIPLFLGLRACRR